MKKAVALMSTAVLLGFMVNTIQVSAAETFPKEYNTEGIITFEAGDEEVTPPVDPEDPDPTDPVDPVDPQDQGQVVHYPLITVQNLNLVYKKFLQQIKFTTQHQMK